MLKAPGKPPAGDPAVLEVAEKTERLIGLMHGEGLEGILLGTQPNFSWLTAGGTNGVDLTREPGVSWLLVCRDGRRFILASAIEMSRMLTEEVEGQGFEPVEYPWTADRVHSAYVLERCRELVGGSTIGTDQPIGDGRVVADDVARLRYRLTPGEIDRLRAMGRDAGEALGEICRGLTPGLRECEIAGRVLHAFMARGMHAAVLQVGADERLSRYRHPIPTSTRWQKIVMVVICARRHGLTVSLSRLVHAGPVSEDLRRRTEATAKVAARLLAATRPGVAGNELYQVAVRAYAEAGFPGEEKRHHQGGSIGYRSRDWVAHPGCAEKVEVPQAFAWNPTITGTKVEETCLVLGRGFEVVTTTPRWPTLSVDAGGTVFQAPDVLSL